MPQKFDVIKNITFMMPIMCSFLMVAYHLGEFNDTVFCCGVGLIAMTAGGGNMLFSAFESIVGDKSVSTIAQSCFNHIKVALTPLFGVIQQLASSLRDDPDVEHYRKESLMTGVSAAEISTDTKRQGCFDRIASCLREDYAIEDDGKRPKHGWF
ncbi:MAG: hypothetical protein ACON5A_02220 [Candidatus Comchoanobacterales bacterium]